MNELLEAQFEDDLATPLDSTRTTTVDGYLVAPAILARAGVFEYHASELGLTDRQPNAVVKVYRSADELKKAVETFESQAVTLDHKWTNATNWRTHAVGDVRDVEMRGGEMAGTLIIRDRAAIDAVKKGTSQLSNGYQAKLVAKTGIFDSKAYEFEQIEFRGNHTAIVPAARCGSVCRIGDKQVVISETKETTHMVTRNFDGLTVSCENEQSAQVVDKMLKQLGDANKEIETLKAAPVTIKLGDKQLGVDEVNAVVVAKDAEIKTLKDAQQTPEQIHALVVSRSNAIAAAHLMTPDLKIGDTDSADTIRKNALATVITKDETAKAMLDAALGTVKLADAPPATVEVAFATISAGLKKAKDSRRVVDSRQQIGAVGTGTASTNVDDVDPRTQYTQRIGDDWKPAAAHTKTEVN